MLYELIAVVRPKSHLEAKEIARSAGTLILRSQGVIRGITNWGAFLLPKPVTRHQARHHAGHYFVMRFDASAATQDMLRRTLALDPRMIRFSVVKLGDRLKEICDVGGRVEWDVNGEKAFDES